MRFQHFVDQFSIIPGLDYLLAQVSVLYQREVSVSDFSPPPSPLLPFLPKLYFFFNALEELVMMMLKRSEGDGQSKLFFLFQLEKVQMTKSQ